MRKRAFRFALVLFQVFLLNVFVPGHTRGMITLPGAREDATHPACCQSHHNSSSSHDAPTSKDRANCAVCFFAARLCAPPVCDLQLQPLGLIALLPPPALQATVAADLFPTYLSRGPPASLHYS